MDCDDKLVELWYFSSLLVWKLDLWTEMFDEGEDE